MKEHIETIRKALDPTCFVAECVKDDHHEHFLALEGDARAGLVALDALQARCVLLERQRDEAMFRGVAAEELQARVVLLERQLAEARADAYDNFSRCEVAERQLEETREKAGVRVAELERLALADIATGGSGVFFRHRAQEVEQFAADCLGVALQTAEEEQ